MKINDIKEGDVLVSTDKNGTGYYKVERVNHITVDVLCENGNTARVRAAIFDRKVTYPVKAFE